MAVQRDGISRREAMTLTSAAVAGAMVPAAAIAAVPIVAKPTPVIPPLTNVWRSKAFYEGLSPYFRISHRWLWKHWTQYSKRSELHGWPDTASNLNYERWWHGEWMLNVAVRTPQSDSEREVMRLAFRMIDEVLADKPEIPWRADMLARLLDARARGAAMGLGPEHPKSGGMSWSTEAHAHAE